MNSISKQQKEMFILYFDPENIFLDNENKIISWVKSTHKSERTEVWQNGRLEPHPEDSCPHTSPLAVCGPKKTFHPELITPKK